MQEYLPIAKRGYLSMTDGSSLGYNGNITLNYNTLFGEKHILYAGIGCEVKQDDSNSHGFTLTGFPDDRYSDPAFAIQFKENSRATSDESNPGPSVSSLMGTIFMMIVISQTYPCVLTVLPSLEWTNVLHLSGPWVPGGTCITRSSLNRQR